VDEGNQLERAARRRRLRRRFRVVAIVAAALLGCFSLDLVVNVGLRSPNLMRYFPRRLRNRVVATYMDERNIIQLDPDCARFDPEVLYTLRPGTFTFSNREFRTTYHVNSLGMRDSEDALQGPEVLVAGDSYAMGWGVEQDETFAALIRKTTGLRTLDTAISSYATVREMLLLDRVDRSKARFLVLQYCRNDFEENARFRENGNRHVGATEEAYRQFVSEHVSQRTESYFPGKYLLRTLFPPSPGKYAGFLVPRPAAPGEEADVFLNALINARWSPLRDLRLVLFDPTKPDRFHEPNSFIDDVRAQLLTPKYAAYAERIKIVDLTPLLDASDYYVLDDHLGPKGHEKIAKAVVDAIRAW